MDFKRARELAEEQSTGYNWTRDERYEIARWMKNIIPIVEAATAIRYPEYDSQTGEVKRLIDAVEAFQESKVSERGDARQEAAKTCPSQREIELSRTFKGFNK